jgi:hypothetical protein
MILPGGQKELPRCISRRKVMGRRRISNITVVLLMGVSIGCFFASSLHDSWLVSLDVCHYSRTDPLHFSASGNIAEGRLCGSGRSHEFHDYYDVL